MYRKDKVELLKWGVFWISETPEVMSKGWDTSQRRICTWGEFKDKASGKKLFYFNTHLDHKSEEAAEKSISLIIKKIQEIAGDNDIYLTGDFNLLIQDMNVKTFDSTYNYNKNFTFNSFHNKLTKTLDAIYFRFGHKFNVEIPNIKLSDHTPVIISV
jgi:endonuclease/exonuclease/phosphatase family metal-dependent hydrolase